MGTGLIFGDRANYMLSQDRVGIAGELSFDEVNPTLNRCSSS
jgi:hypothetical protein